VPQTHVNEGSSKFGIKLGGLGSHLYIILSITTLPQLKNIGTGVVVDYKF